MEIGNRILMFVYVRGSVQKDVRAVANQMPWDVSMEVSAGVEDDEENLGITTSAIATVTAKFARPSKPAISTKIDDKLPPNQKDFVEVHCPLVGVPKNEVWYLFLADERTDLIYNAKKMPYLRDGVEIKLPFPAPPKPGRFNLTVFLLCDSYVGFDIQKTVTFEVKKAPKMKKMVEDEDEGRKKKKIWNPFFFFFWF